ncbi:ABC-F family ATP-binding cassette domain-containing protein [Lachnoclostridium sp. An76]|uniref:ABC-F family ATP-binding cassette domain-containing protein n=1 Tax=Lachnoclostridium sp. An76 TaxID=1965654 RepID=UPI000B367F1D|nr:ABC-F family ATP-binding cassette domain-containing protein [Lachnoclostridium sp. An76]OUN35849.1 zinc/iron permease [Lachnoclostridium sp. An76]
MNIINIEHISKIYGEKTIYEDASFGIQQGDKIGIVGINGTGKSTLLRMIAGEETPDEGQIIRQNGLKIAYIPQNPVFPEGEDIRSYALSERNGEDWQVESNLTELGITDLDQEIAHLSGGQKRKVVLAKTLAGDFDVLLLDEPTNHLDGEMITWLEEYLRGYRGTILMVTHDRYFLDRVTNRILEISRGKMYGYDADYSGFLELKAAREEMELASERKRQSILRMELEWAKRGCRARSTKQRARLERLEALKNGKAPAQDQTVELGSVETRMGKKTIELHHVSKRYGDKKILEDYSYIVLKNQRLGIIGPNGCGKSTVMKLIAGLEEPDSGKIEIGETVRIGYFAQEEQHMDDGQRVIDYVKDIAEYITTTDGKISASSLLERFLFTPDMQYAPIGKLSGGEKRRLYLLGVLAENANVLLLDEPGNNLDIPTLTILEDYLNSFSGIVIAVSHDRYFLDNIADRILELDGEGHVTQYEGGYTDYLEAKTRKMASAVSADGTGDAGAAGRSRQKGDPAQKGSAPGDTSETAKKSGKSWKQDQPQKLKFSYKEQREYETIDDDIAAIEAKLETIGRQIEANATNSVKLKELLEEQEKTQGELDEKMERWVYLNDLAEKIAEQG